jgi:hypothetical protein
VVTGEVSTVAGDGASAITDGNGTSASFRNPKYLAMNHDSMVLYVIEYGNDMNFQCRLREIDLATMDVTTIAGTGGIQNADCPLADSKFSYRVEGIGYCNGIITLVDHNNNLVRELNLIKDSMFVYSYNDSDFGRIAMHNDTAYFYDNRNLKYFDPISKSVKDLGSYFSSNDRFQAFEMDPMGYLYSRLQDGPSIYKSDVSKSVTMLFAGNGQGFMDGRGDVAMFDYAKDIAYAADSGYFFVLDYNNQAIRKIYFGEGNTPPSFTPGGLIMHPEDTGAMSFPWATNISEGIHAWEEGQQLMFIIDVAQPTAFATLPTMDTNGVLSYEVAADSNGIYTCYAQLKDDGGTFGGVADTSNRTVFTIRVMPVNDAPSFTPGSDITTCPDGNSVSQAWATGISVGPDNESSQTPSFVVSNDNVSLFTTQPAIDASGQLSFEVAASTTGTAVVSVKLIDNGGTGNGGVDSTSTVTFDIDVYLCPSVTETQEEELVMYPNPSNGLVYMEGIEEAKVIVRDILGSVILVAEDVDSVEELDLTSQPAGVYTIEIIQGEKAQALVLVIE